MTAAVLVAVIAALPAVLAQPGQMGPEPCSTEPACVEAMSCAKRREPFYWRNVFDINRCHLSMEVRVGLTVSMTGPLSRNATTEQILQTLRNLSSAKGQVDFVSIGVSFPYCLIFCVMDDESLPWKAVEHYRVFAGDSGYDSCWAVKVSKVPKGSMDVMLGPSSSDFRLAAAQVADEFQRPLVSWSLPEIMGISFVRPAQSTVRSTGAWLGNLLGSNSVIETDNVFGRLPEELLFTCRDLVVPSNYSLRTMAQFLPCDGPCDLSRDLDYCAVPRQELSITGHWDPPSVLRSGGWENGCLSFDSNGTAARLEIVMIFDTPRAMVNVDFWGGNSKTGPLLVLGSRLYSSSPPGPLVLPSGTQVMLDSSSDERIEFSICLKQDCQHFTCPAGYKRTAFGSLCNGVQCAPEDLQNCCALDQLPHVNGPFWSNSFTSVLDLAVPPKNWLDNTLPRLLHPRSQFVLCVAQSDTDGLFSDLCTSHINQAIQVGFRTLEKHLPVINADPGVHNALINLMLTRPKPSVILICSELETYSRFIHGLTAMHITFEWIVSCIPFGAQLQTKVPGSPFLTFASWVDGGVLETVKLQLGRCNNCW
ncbi:unnamed protein product [Cladocopium goreaui]|uniref:Tyrosine-protein kinase ephrin type A/B receptor-like domain-containing protein n=1 Tax=Cladocopium goreaui TaxID=2562237 RepID=A0A9P1GJN1_9DINO|nr:unnamed protein product [Cladocopium goreaui]